MKVVTTARVRSAGQGPQRDLERGVYAPVGHAPRTGPPLPSHQRRCRCSRTALLCFALCALACTSSLVTTLFTLERLSSKSLVFLAWLIPTQGMWDYVHTHHSTSSALWGYADDHVPHPELVGYIAERPYESVLDVSCSVGLMIGALAARHPERAHYGSDISSAMAELAKAHCPTCEVDTFDLSTLQRREITGWPSAFPASFDYIYVSDVLYYMSWEGVPPALYHAGVVKDLGDLPSQRRFFDHLVAMAREEVVFSNHQNNTRVVRFLRKMGAHEKDGVWVARGKAKPLQQRLGGAHSAG